MAWRKTKGEKLAAAVDALIAKSDKAIGKATKIAHLQAVMRQLNEKAQDLLTTRTELTLQQARADEIIVDLHIIEDKARRMRKKTWEARYAQEVRDLKKEADKLNKEISTLKEQNVTLEHLVEQEEKITEAYKRTLRKISDLAGEIGGDVGDRLGKMVERMQSRFPK